MESFFAQLEDEGEAIGDPRIIDLTAQADKSRRLLTRDPKKVYALVLHQMACCFNVSDPLKRFLKIAPHFAILPDGRIIQLHPILSLTAASNGFNSGSVAVEFAGNFPDTRSKWWIDTEELRALRAKLRTLPEAQTQARLQGYIKANQNRVTPAQIEAGRYLVRYLIRTMGLRTILAHRQSSGTRDNDPGPDIWYNVGQWAIDNLGLTDGGPGFKVDTGKPIPDLWRKWGQAKPQPELEFSNHEFEKWGPVSGRWFRRRGTIILDDPRSGATAANVELFREFPRADPLFPPNPTRSPGRPSPLPVPLFPPKPADPLTTDLKMDRALKNAIANLEKARKLTPGTLPVRFTLVEVTNASAGSFPSAGYLETETDYIASEAKVAIMYSAYALRDMVQRFAASTGANPANLFFRLRKQMDPSIAKASRNIAVSLLMDVHRVPSYRDVFAVQPASFGFRATVAFTPGFSKALEGMIVPSNNAAAGTCVHGVGYGYLNGALAARGFFDPSNDQGLWVAGDFQQGKKWPYVRIVSRNDGLVAQAGTTRDMAKLVALIMTDRVLDAASCEEMRGRLARAAKGIDTPWVARTGIFKPGTITHNKLGLGPLKSGRSVRSEVSVYQSPVAKGRRYVVAWQNLVGLLPIAFADIAKVIKEAITEFEK